MSESEPQTQEPHPLAINSLKTKRFEGKGGSISLGATGTSGLIRRSPSKFTVRKKRY